MSDRTQCYPQWVTFRFGSALALVAVASACGTETNPLEGDAGARDGSSPPPSDASQVIHDDYWDASPPPPTCVPLTKPSVVLADKLDGPNGLTLDASNVYFAEARIYTAKLESIPKSGGPLGNLGWGGGAYGMANDATSVYWVSYGALPAAPPGSEGGISRVAKANGATTILAYGTYDSISDGRWTRLAMTSSSLFWIDTGKLSNQYVTGRVLEVPKGGGKTVVLAADQDFATDIVANSSFVWWMAGDGIHQVSTSGGLTSVFIPYPGYPKTYPRVGIEDGALALDDEFLYFTFGDGIQRAPIATAKPQPLYTGDVVSMTTDAACIYFATKSAIFQMAKSGGPATPIATVAGQVWSMAADDSGLYYLDYDKGELRRVAR